MKSMEASVFKTRCPAVIAEIQVTREAVQIAKGGKPFVRVQPFDGPLDSSIKVWELEKTSKRKCKTKAQ
jgi:hypothetical protein